MKSDRERLLDILEAIERIERHTTCTRDAFDRDELLQTWVVHHIQIIGEASRKLSDTFRNRTFRSCMAADHRNAQHSYLAVANINSRPRIDRFSSLSGCFELSKGSALGII